MLQIKNTYDDRDVTVVSRAVATGSDGTETVLAAGDSCEIEVDGDHQVAVYTRARHPGEAALSLTPVAQPLADEASQRQAEEAQLTDASDDQVRTVIQQMVEQKTDLTAAGEPNLAVLNAKLAEQNFNPITADRRKELMPAA